MSSSAHISIDEGEYPVKRDDWLAFCTEEGIRYEPHVAGYNVFYKDGVELTFGDSVKQKPPRLANGHLDFSKAEPPEEAYQISVSTYFMGGDMPEVARLAALIWHRFHGHLSAATEISALLVPAKPVLDEFGYEVEPDGPRGRPSALAERAGS